MSTSSTTPTAGVADAPRPPAYADPIPFSSGTRLTLENFDLVNDFICARAGQPETRWEQEVREWLTGRGRESAYEAIRIGELVDVRLFYHVDESLIGYGAIGPVEWALADQSKVRLYLLHFCGVHTQFRAQQGIEPHRRYGRRILGGMLEAAVALSPDAQCQGVALYVDPENDAKKIYIEFGFKDIEGEPWPDPENNGRLYWRMARSLDAPLPK